MTSSGSLARAGLLVTGAFLASRILGWLRLVAIGHAFASPGDLDPFLAAFRIPDLIFQLVAAGALSTALIPVLAGLRATGQEARAWQVASTVATLMMGVLFVLALGVAIFAPSLVPPITPGFDAVRTARTVELTRIMTLSPVLLAGGALASSLLNSTGRFGAAALAPLVYNLAIIGAAVFVAPTFGLDALAVGVVVGAALHLAVQLPALRDTGFRYVARFDLGDPHARQALLLMAPRAIGLAASQLTFIVATSLATNLTPGSLTAFTFAFTIFQIPLGVVGLPIGVVTLPRLSGDLARGEVGRYLDLLTGALRLVLFLMVPLTVLGIILRRPSIVLLFPVLQGATLDAAAAGLLCLLLALASESAIAILGRAFYADRDTLTPVLAAVLAVALNVSLSVILVGPLGLAGIGLAIAVGSLAEAALLVGVLHHRRPGFRPARVISSGVVALGVALVAGAVSLAVDSLIGGGTTGSGVFGLGLRGRALVELILAGGAGGLAFAVVATVLRIPEVAQIGRLVGDAVRHGPAAS